MTDASTPTQNPPKKPSQPFLFAKNPQYIAMTLGAILLVAGIAFAWHEYKTPASTQQSANQSGAIVSPVPTSTPAVAVVATPAPTSAPIPTKKPVASTPKATPKPAATSAASVQCASGVSAIVNGVDQCGATLATPVPAPVPTSTASSTVPNCGEGGFNGNTCFNQKFTICSPASMTLSIQAGVVYYYEIQGSQSGGCSVMSKYLENSAMPSWTGQQMACIYDNTKDPLTALSDHSRCSGPLYSLMYP